jgi:hypothetical protein
MNKSKNDQTDYINATKECFARAFQQYFGMKTEGEDAFTKNVDNKVAPEGIEIWKHPNFVNKFTFKDEIEPLIEQFLKENLDVFETTVDIDGTNDLATITEEEAVVDEVDGKLISLIKKSDFNFEKEPYKQDWLKKANKSIESLNGYIKRFYDGQYKNNSEIYNAEGNSLKFLREINSNLDWLQPLYIGSEKWISLIDDIQTKFDESHEFGLKLISNENKPTEEPEESIEDLIEGLKVMLEYSEGEEKEELENTIEGLKLLL